MRIKMIIAVMALALTEVSVAYAEDFLTDAKLTGGLYYWQRERDRRDMNPVSTNYGKYVTNLTHAAANINLDFSSGYLWDTIGLDIAVFGALEIAHARDSGHPNEMSFSKANRTYDEDWSGDKSGMSLYKAALKLKTGSFWLRAGYIQPTGQTLLAPHWSFMPGTYRGAEAGMILDYADSGELKFSYLWTDRYKAPWHLEMDNFRWKDKLNKISYLHAIGAKYDFKNGLTLESSMAQAQGYIDQYFAKIGWQSHTGENILRTSYQFYGANSHSISNDNNKMYDGLAWMQAITLGYLTGPWQLRLEGTIVNAPGHQGYILKRITPGYASSNGRLDVYWDNRSDFNAHGEKAMFFSVLYNLKNWNLPGLAVGGSYVYGWDAKPSSSRIYDQSQRVRESSLSADVQYTVQRGKIKDTQFKLHMTWYDNHSAIPTNKNGFGNLFQDEHDVKFMIIAPFTLF